MMSRALLLYLAAVGAMTSAFAGETPIRVFTIDLSTTLRLAGAQTLDIQIARERLAEARGVQESAIEKFLPSAAPGIAYRRHDNLIQNTEGVIEEVHKQSFAPGATITAQADIGDAIFKSLVAHQLVKAAGHALDAQRQDSIVAAAQAYFDLVAAHSGTGVAREALRLSADYQAQIEKAVSIGLAFKGDALRVKVQRQRDAIALTQAEERARLAAARLAQILHLDATVELWPRDNQLVALSLVSATPPAELLVEQALAARPETKQNAALLIAARQNKNGAVYGPLIPTLGGQAFIGELGGGKGSQTGNFGESEDYAASLSWRIGPGGLFDFGQGHVQQARLRTAHLTGEKVRDEIAQQVVASRTRVLSFAEQLDTARQSLADTQENLRLDQERKEFGVGVVLETILAEQELTRARNDYLRIVADYNKAQYDLLRALGQIAAPPPTSSLPLHSTAPAKPHNHSIPRS
jgi:outer membrane protein TolC